VFTYICIYVHIETLPPEPLLFFVHAYTYLEIHLYYPEQVILVRNLQHFFMNAYAHLEIHLYPKHNSLSDF
jgi:hypothetical protein